MVRNEFAGTLYHTTTDMLDAIAEEWVSGCGVWDEDTQRDILDESTDAELAGDAINDWDLARSENGPTHMELNGYTADDLAAAFGRLRERIQAAR
jgi:hypothetical protein